MNIIKKHTFKHFDENEPVSIVYHIDLGTEAGTLDWILNGPKSVSYNYYITRDGRVIELVPWHFGAWHSGVVHRPTERAKEFFSEMVPEGRGMVQKPVNPNKKSIGVCYEGMTEFTKATEAQVKSGYNLRNYLAEETGREFEDFAHQEITSYKPNIVHDFKKRVLDYKPKEGKENTLCKVLDILKKINNCS